MFSPPSALNNLSDTLQLLAQADGLSASAEVVHVQVERKSD